MFSKKDVLFMFTSTKKELIFFDQFSSVISSTCDAAARLKELVDTYEDVEGKIAEIEKIEHKCDVEVHNILKQLNRSFITPIDREDIFIIAKEMDNITDNIESTAHRFKLFNIKEASPVAKEMVGLIINCTTELNVIFKEFKNMKTSKILHEKIVEVNRIENQGDEIYRNAIQNLFLNEQNPIELIKWKEIYEYMEKSIDSCEDVANIVEGIVTKNV